MENINFLVHAEFIVLLVSLLVGFSVLDEKLDKQKARSDRLYEMFIDLLKEEKGKK